MTWDVKSIVKPKTTATNNNNYNNKWGGMEAEHTCLNRWVFLEYIVMNRVGFFKFFLLFRHKISEFRINCFKFTQYFAKISRLIFIIIIRESFVTNTSK